MEIEYMVVKSSQYCKNGSTDPALPYLNKGSLFPNKMFQDMLFFPHCFYHFFVILV